VFICIGKRDFDLKFRVFDSYESRTWYRIGDWFFIEKYPIYLFGGWFLWST